MSRNARFPEQVIAQAQLDLRNAATPAQLRRAQAVLLPALFGLTKSQTAAAVGLGPSRVRTLQAEARNPSLVPKAAHGGRRREYMIFVQEAAFLKP